MISRATVAQVALSVQLWQYIRLNACHTHVVGVERVDRCFTGRYQILLLIEEDLALTQNFATQRFVPPLATASAPQTYSHYLG